MSVSLKDVGDLLAKTNLAVISSIADDGRPQSAVLEFASTPELEIIIDLYGSSRKFVNLKRDPRTALVIGWDDNITLQLEGHAEELTGSELERCKQMYFAKNPRAKKWENEPGITYIKITPAWLRYSDLNHRPWNVKEFTVTNGKLEEQLL